MYPSVLIFVDDPDVIKINEFICNHYRDIDEIVLSYVVSILQDLADMSDEESFDVDAFVETIVAYMPVTEVIPADEITEWMFALAKEQREKNARKNKHQIDLKSVIEETIQKSQQQRKSSESNSIEMNLETTDKKSGSRISESSDPDPDCTTRCFVFFEPLEILKNLRSFSFLLFDQFLIKKYGGHIRTNSRRRG